MLKPTPKQEFLANLQARNRRNREVVETTFVPLNEAQRALAAYEQRVAMQKSAV
jgi:hypothetical protein